MLCPFASNPLNWGRYRASRTHSRDNTMRPAPAEQGETQIQWNASSLHHDKERGYPHAHGPKGSGRRHVGGWNALILVTSTRGHRSYPFILKNCHSWQFYVCVLFFSALPSVISSAYCRSLPIGNPRARRVTLISGDSFFITFCK